MKSTRRQFLTVGAMGAAAAVVPAAARATFSSNSLAQNKDRLFQIAEAELQRNGDRIAHNDRVGIADFSPYSSSPRFYLLDRESGGIEEFLVAHGRGSDPHHLGWLQKFSNEPGSNATSRGAYVTQERYDGVHGAAMRLNGLDMDNYMARLRAIVVHSAWYAEPDMIAKYGKLGRSEGCFAFPSEKLSQILDRLGEGRLLFADRLADYSVSGESDGHDAVPESIWPSTTFSSAG